MKPVHVFLQNWERLNTHEVASARFVKTHILSLSLFNNVGTMRVSNDVIHLNFIKLKLYSSVKFQWILLLYVLFTLCIFLGGSLASLSSPLLREKFWPEGQILMKFGIVLILNMHAKNPVIPEKSIWGWYALTSNNLKDAKNRNKIV